METDVDYVVSTYPSRFEGYQSKRGTKAGKRHGKLTFYVSTIWNNTKKLDVFVFTLSIITVLERICLERAFNKIRLKDRCEPKPCKMNRLVKNMHKMSGNWIFVAEEYEL